MQTNISTCTLSMFTPNSSHCYTFPSYFMTASYGINMILGFPLHCYILWLSVKEMTRGKSPEIFIFNASLVEVIFSFIFVFVIEIYNFHCVECKNPVIFLGVTLFVGRPLFLSCICVERYLGVLHPVMFLKLKPMKYRIACSAVGWIVIFSSSVICATGVVIHYTFILPVFLIFFFIKLYACLMVLNALLRPGPHDDLKQRDAVHQDKLKAFRIILTILVATSLTYVPGILSLVLYYIVDFGKFIWFWTGFVCFGTMTGFVQPFLYLKRLGKLRFGQELNKK